MRDDPPPVRDFARPAGEIESVYVNGVPMRPGRDYDLLADRLRFRRPLRARRGPGAWGNLLTALCAGVEPAGDEVDLIVRAGPARRVVHAAPIA